MVLDDDKKIINIIEDISKFKNRVNNKYIKFVETELTSRDIKIKSYIFDSGLITEIEEIEEIEEVEEIEEESAGVENGTI